MDLIFNSKPVNFRCFNFRPGRNSKEYEDFFGPKLASLSSELKRNANVVTEHIAKCEPQSIFVISKQLDVNFNLASRVALKHIIDDFITKIKFKKYKGLTLWIPLLQDHFWQNSSSSIELEYKSKPLTKKKSLTYGNAGKAPRPSFIEDRPIPSVKKSYIIETETGSLPDSFFGDELQIEPPGDTSQDVVQPSKGLMDEIRNVNPQTISLSPEYTQQVLQQGRISIQQAMAMAEAQRRARYTDGWYSSTQATTTSTATQITSSTDPTNLW